MGHLRLTNVYDLFCRKVSHTGRIASVIKVTNVL